MSTNMSNVSKVSVRIVQCLVRRNSITTITIPNREPSNSYSTCPNACTRSIVLRQTNMKRVPTSDIGRACNTPAYSSSKTIDCAIRQAFVGGSVIILLIITCLSCYDQAMSRSFSSAIVCNHREIESGSFGFNRLGPRPIVLRHGKIITLLRKGVITSILKASPSYTTSDVRTFKRPIILRFSIITCGFRYSHLRRGRSDHGSRIMCRVTSTRNSVSWKECDSLYS